MFKYCRCNANGVLTNTIQFNQEKFNKYIKDIFNYKSAIKLNILEWPSLVVQLTQTGCNGFMLVTSNLFQLFIKSYWKTWVVNVQKYHYHILVYSENRKYLCNKQSQFQESASIQSSICQWINQFLQRGQEMLSKLSAFYR